jgi:hypothetical protein
LKKSVEEEKNYYQRVCGHLKAFIKFKNEKFTEEEFKTEAASYLAQLKIQELLNKDKKKCNSFEINEEFDLTCEDIEKSILSSIVADDQKNKIKGYCANQEMKKTTFYTYLKADGELKKLWKKRAKLPNEKQEPQKEIKKKILETEILSSKRKAEESKREFEENETDQTQIRENEHFLCEKRFEQSESERFKLTVDCDLLRKKCLVLQSENQALREELAANHRVVSFTRNVYGDDDFFNSRNYYFQPAFSEGYNGGLSSNPYLANS